MGMSKHRVPRRFERKKIQSVKKALKLKETLSLAGRRMASIRVGWGTLASAKKQKINGVRTGWEALSLQIGRNKMVLVMKFQFG